MKVIGEEWKGKRLMRTCVVHMSPETGWNIRELESIKILVSSGLLLRNLTDDRDSDPH